MAGDVSGSDTLSERAANLVEQDIIAGVLAPGARLGIIDLVQRYDIGATPLPRRPVPIDFQGMIVESASAVFGSPTSAVRTCSILRECAR